MQCELCNSEMHFICLYPTEDSCCCEETSSEHSSIKVEMLEFSEGPREPARIGRPPKDNDDIQWVETSGRKRAVEAKKADGWIAGQPCEWSHLKFAGGGVVPIMGCNSNPSKPVHHGPDKNTLNNSLGNIHAICTVCHQRWHACNDEFYSGDRPAGDNAYVPKVEYKLHDAETLATDDEILINEYEWVNRRRLSKVAIKNRK